MIYRGLQGVLIINSLNLRLQVSKNYLPSAKRKAPTEKKSNSKNNINNDRGRNNKQSGPNITIDNGNKVNNDNQSTT